MRIVRNGPRRYRRLKARRPLRRTAPSGRVIDEAARAAAAAAGTEIEASLGIKGDRLARLFEALDSVKDRVDNLRLIRVMQGEDPPPSARKVGDFYYLSDLMPRP